jgi:hypothetical protein
MKKTIGQCPASKRGSCVYFVGFVLLAGCQPGKPPAFTPPREIPPGPETVHESALAPYRGPLQLTPLDPPTSAETPSGRPETNCSIQHLEPLLERVRHQVPPAEVPCLGHAEDYRWLTGEIRYYYVRNVWCLQYASADEDDEQGGCVTLVNAGPMTGFHNGQCVRVEGRLLDPCSREPNPAYEMHSIRPLTSP